MLFSTELEHLRRANSLLTSNKELEVNKIIDKIRNKIIESYQASDERVAAGEQLKHTGDMDVGASDEYYEQRPLMRTDIKENRSTGCMREEDVRNKGSVNTDGEGFLLPPQPQRAPRERKMPRIISNVRVAPPRTVQFEKPALAMESNGNEDCSSASEWETADRIRKRARKRKKKPNMESDEMEASPAASIKKPNKKAGNVGPKRRAPRSVAISIKKMSQELSYADILRKARTKVLTNELGINDTKIRKAANEAVTIEISGNNSKGKAEKLKERLKQVFGEDEVQISRPEIKGDLRIVGFDDSVLGKDISQAIRTVVDCDEEDIKVDAIRPMKNGLFMTFHDFSLDPISFGDCYTGGGICKIAGRMD